MFERVGKAVSAFILTLYMLLSGCDENTFNQLNIDRLRSGSKHSADVALLQWHEFFKLPVGAQGLEPTEKLLKLQDKTVRLQGYMVKEEEPMPGLFMLAGLPVSMSEREDGPADDLPPATVYVHLPDVDKDKIVKFKSGMWELTGILTTGNKEEANGRMSFVQLKLN